MGYHPTVTVVTPSYNQGEFLAATIESVLSQEGDFHLEYLIMDGGSSDDSVEIMRHVDGLLERGEWPVRCRGITYRWVSEKDKGQADAVNKGFAAARGSILGWLNSDDTYLPGAIAAALESFEKNPELVMVYGNAWFTDREGACTVPYRTEPFRLQRMAERCIVCQPAVFLRREVLQAVGYLDAALHTCLDYEYWIRVGKRFEDRIGFIEPFLATSRLYADNKTLSLRELTYAETMMVTKRHFGYVPGVWIVHSLLEAVQGQDATLTEKTRMLAGRLRFLAYLVQPKTLCSVICFMASRLRKREATSSWLDRI